MKTRNVTIRQKVDENILIKNSRLLTMTTIIKQKEERTKLESNLVKVRRELAADPEASPE